MRIARSRWTTLAVLVRTFHDLMALMPDDLLERLGLVSQQLCQYVKSVVGVDISQVSVDLYNTQASNQGLAPEEMRAVCTELKGEPGELDGLKFDIIVVSRLVVEALSSHVL